MLEQNMLGLVSCWTAFTLAAMVPGPNNVAVISVALGSGRRSGLYVAVGVAIGAFFWALITAYGLAKLFEIYPQLIKVFAIAGGGYLSYLGIKAIRTVLSKSQASNEYHRVRIDRCVLHGLTVTATNPKAALFWLSLSTMVSGVSGSVAGMLFFAMVIAVLSFIVYGGYALAFSVKKVRDWYDYKKNYFTLIFAGYFLLAGLALILILGIN